MSEVTTTPEAPKSSPAKKFFRFVAILLALLALDHYTYNFVGIGAEVTVTDSTIVIAPSVDTTVSTVEADTTK